jgi:hypothetical protein
MYENIKYTCMSGLKLSYLMPVLLGKGNALNSGKSLSKYAETGDFVRFVVAMPG